MSDLKLQIRLEVQTAQGESALKRFESAVDAALGKLRKPADIAIIKQLAAEVEAGKKKLDEVPAQWRRDVETINQISRGIRLLDEVGLSKSHAQIRQSINDLKTQFTALKQSGVLTHTELAQAAVRTREKIRELSESMRVADRHADALSGAFSKVQVAFSALAGLVAGNRFFAVSDAMSQLSARLALVEGGSMRAKDRLRELFSVANRGQTDVEAVGDAYVRFANTLVSVGRSTDEALKLTEALMLSLRVSGASAQETSAVMLQLGQALQRGKLSGDEFVSVAENGGMVLDYLARALGVSRSKLLEMSQSGELTVEKILKLNDALDLIRRDAEKIPQTVAGSFEVLSNAAKQWVTTSEGVGVAGKALIFIFQKIGENFGTVVDLLMLAGVGVIIARFGAITNAARSLGAALGVIAGMTPVARVIAAIAAAIALSWDSIKKLWDSFTSNPSDALARRLETVAGTLKQVEGAAQKASEAIKSQLDSAIKQASESVKSLSTGYAQVASDIKAAMDARIAEIDSYYKLQEAAAQRAALSEVAYIRETTQALLVAEREKISVVENSAQKMDEVLKSTYSQAVSLARAAGLDIQAIEREGIEARIAIYSQLESAYRSTIDRLIAEEQRHLQAAKAADEARLNLRLSVEDRIRELARKGMDEYSAYLDRLRQIDEKQAQARKALAEGNFEQARRLAEESISLAERSASAVTRQVEINGKRITETIVSESAAASKAIVEIKESASIADAALKGLGDAHRQAADEIQRNAENMQTFLQFVSERLNTLRAELLTKDKLKLDVDISSAEESVEKIKALIEAEKIAVALTANVQEAQDTIAKLKSDINNMSLTAEVTANVDKVLTDINRLKEIVAEAKIDLPVSFDQTRAQLESFVQDARAMLSEPTSATHTPQPDMSQYYSARSILEQPTSSTHTIYVQKVEANAMGGLIGRFAAGGRAIAGAFRRMTGKIIGPGTETSDSIPALLSNGEFVIRASSVRRFGVAFFEALNAGFLPPVIHPMPYPVRFADGGLAGTTPSAARDVVDLRFHVGGKVHTVQSSRETAMHLAYALRELSRGA